MCLPFLNLFVWYDALLRGWRVAYVGDVKVHVSLNKMSRLRLTTGFGLMTRLTGFSVTTRDCM
jgi:hypothetical protein